MQSESNNESDYLPESNEFQPNNFADIFSAVRSAELHLCANRRAHDFADVYALSVVRTHGFPAPDDRPSHADANDAITHITTYNSASINLRAADNAADRNIM